MTSADAPDNGASVMLRIDQTRAFPRALGFVLAGVVSVSACDGAFAKSRAKKTVLERLVMDTPNAGMTAPPVRFFTINQVLAKRDSENRAKPGNIELASLDASQGSDAKVISDAPSPAAILPATSEEPFGLFTFRAPEGLLWTKWRGVEARMRADLKSIEDCKADSENCAAGARKFVAVTRSAAELGLRTRVEAINRDVNYAIRYVGDYQQYGVADLWSSPLETLSAGIGDCEDYAIAKFAMLVATGVPEADIKMMLVRDMAVRQDHAVLTVRVDGRWLVLDNRYSRLSETRDLPHFMPLFAIDHKGVSLFAAPYATRPHHESETDMLPAAEVDGFGGGSSLPLAL
ncbi:transglutaminase-like cysteine peptidase [Tardiphaga sp. 42S5]|uniref:transglutaminase-like cysteine peptidase n=1 Tax=Tardiphaga sp. 42S5 TaxID=1404799 RepID=UPI002A5ACC72|nr:transglutaminase-like cysteine peptidase [Tardiphaga sp. 42S5]WPO38874.1 transglutaminase-like cysteine peptidase [Tardiphaga sp. 42S5]